jgi:hypothetical protein
MESYRMILMLELVNNSIKTNPPNFKLKLHDNLREKASEELLSNLYPDPNFQLLIDMLYFRIQIFQYFAQL